MRQFLLPLAAAIGLSLSALTIAPASAGPALPADPGIAAKAASAHVELAHWRHRHWRHRHHWGAPWAYYGGYYSNCFWTRRGVYVCSY